MKRYLSLFAHRTRSLWVVPTVVAALSVILAACGGSTTTAAPTPTTAPTTAPTPTPTPTPVVANVKMVEKVPGHYSFDPPMLMVKVGTQVVWTNASDAPHTVTSDTGVFNSPNKLKQNDTFMFTFTTAGTFAYHCNVHPYMKATIVVS
jgi:plastocyanin